MNLEELQCERRSVRWVKVACAFIAVLTVLICWTAINGMNGIFESSTDRGAMMGLCGLVAMGIIIVVALVGAVTDGE